MSLCTSLAWGGCGGGEFPRTALRHIRALREPEYEKRNSQSCSDVTRKKYFPVEKGKGYILLLSVPLLPVTKVTLAAIFRMLA
jgi:hypothetical protein